MKLLHVAANLGGGILVVLKELTAHQNRLENFEAKVLVVKKDQTQLDSEYFENLGERDFEDFISGYRPDAVIFHSHYYFEYLKFYKILVRRNIPYYIEPHGAFGTAAQEKSKYKKIIANRFVLNHFVKSAKGYIFLNDNEKKDSVFHTENDLVIHNGINTSEILKESVDGTKSYFYYIGRFDVFHKGLDVLFDALDLIEKKKEPVTLKMYGLGIKKDEEYINKRISSYKIVSVTNCGALDKKDQPEKLEQCGIMVLTSRYEGFPMTVLEAWKFGNPCVVTPGTNVYDEITANGLGWGTRLNAVDIANALLDAQKDYLDKRNFYINKTKEYVELNYNWTRIAQTSYDLFSLALKM